MNNENTCIMCGAVIPEGIQVCPNCENRVIKEKTNEHSTYDSYIYRGDIYFADLNPVVGSEIGGVRPVVILQNDVGNKYSSTLIAAVTSRVRKHSLPVHVSLTNNLSGLTEDTTILLEQIRTIDKRRLKHYVGHLDGETMNRIDRAAALSIGLDSTEEREAQYDGNI